MPSELLKHHVKWLYWWSEFLTLLTILSQLDLLILVLTMPQHLKRFFHNGVANKLFDNEWEKSGICYRRQLNAAGSKSNPILLSFSII